MIPNENVVCRMAILTRRTDPPAGVPVLVVDGVDGVAHKAT